MLKRIIFIASEVGIDFTYESNWETIVADYSFLHSQILNYRQLSQLEVDYLHRKLMLFDTHENFLAALHSFEEGLAFFPLLNLEHKCIVCYPKMFPHEFSELLLNPLLLQKERILPPLENEVFRKVGFRIGSFLRVGQHPEVSLIVVDHFRKKLCVE